MNEKPTSFPRHEEFAAHGDHEPVLKWRDMPLAVFRVDYIHPVSTRFGPALLMRLEDEAGKTLSAWAPSGLIQKVQDEFITATSMYVLNRGLKACKKDKSHSFFDVELITRRP